MPEPPASTREPKDVHRIDGAALERWMSANVDGFEGPLSVRKFRGGQSNPTYWIGTPGRAYALRKKPPGDLLPSAHAVEREYRVMTALRDTDVPVARTFGLCEDPRVIGTPFFLMEHVAGRIFWNVQLPEIATREERRSIYEEAIRVLAALHRVDIDAVGLSDYGKRGGYVARQVERWTKQYRATETSPVPSMDALIDFLPAHLPTNDETTLTHGDYRLDNLIYHPTEPRILAVIDWELSTLGHPLSDLAYMCMLYDVMLPRVGGLLGVDFDATGIPSEKELLARYGALTGRGETPDDWAYFKAFSLFRLAAIAQGVFRRSELGNASSDDAAMYGAAVAHLSQIAVSLLGLSASS
jgi:aminoglycoside phosphotransferase (APT) family kinase protein